MLVVATDEMFCTTPGMSRQRLQALQCIDTSNRRVGGQRPLATAPKVALR